ncbi:MAG TPA: hypothetical protein VNY05_03155 [Candidatus Acidoferrales bacterium]|jgi:uncharacterized protein (TIGR03437 family)|nr:hypothetical protein [Candidatus Acidoferrales bacterium]
MLRASLVLCLFLPGSGFAQSSPLSITSAAGLGTGLSAEGLATATGSGLAGQTAAAQSSPWPTTLGGVTVQVQDSGSVSRPAGLLFVSPGQINFQIPAGTALGPAAVTINNGGALMTAIVPVQTVAPALFALNSQGVAAATAVAIAIPTVDQFPVPVFQCGDTAQSCQLVPIDPGLDRPVFLSFFATGIRGRSGLGNVTVKMGTVIVAATYAGPQGQFAGLDQINVPLLLSLRGAGEISVTVTADGVTSNPVKVSVK